MIKFLKNGYARYLVLLLYLFIPLALSSRIPNIDFHKAYFPIGKSILDTGTFSYTHEGFKNIPLVGLLLVPFAIGGRAAGALRFLLFELLCYLAAFAVAERLLARTSRDRWVMLGLFALSIGFFNAVFFGQLTLAAFLLYLLAIAAWSSRRRAAAGALVASLFLLKIPPGLLVLYFAVKREARILVAAVVTYLIFAAASLALFGARLHQDYSNSVLMVNRGRTQIAYNNQNLFAFVIRLLHPAAPFDWRMFTIPRPLSILLPAAAVLAVVGLLALILWRGRVAGAAPRSELEMEIGMVSCLFLMVFPVSWDHYYLFLIYPFFIAWKASRGPRIPLLAVAFVMANFPVLPILLARWLRSGPGLQVLMALPFLGCALLLVLLALSYLRVTRRDVA